MLSALQADYRHITNTSKGINGMFAYAEASVLNPLGGLLH